MKVGFGLVNTDEEKGQLGRWLKTQREAHGYKSQRELIEALQTAGYRVHQSQYGAIEARGIVTGPAQERLLKRVAQHYGVPVPDFKPKGDSPELIAALISQTAAITALVERLDSLASVAVREGVAQGVREAAVLRAAGASRSGQPPEPPA